MNKMKWIFSAIALTLATGLVAYGVSPSSSGGGAGAPAQQNTMGNPGGPQPQPIRLGQNNGQPGQPAAQPGAATTPLWQNYQPPQWAQGWEHLDFETAKKWSADPTVVFVDARAKVEYDQGHIPGAIPMPIGEFDKFYAEYESKIKKASKLVAYCHGIGCKLSEKVAQKLVNDKGHKNVAVFFGGWPQWNEHNMPVEK